MNCNRGSGSESDTNTSTTFFLLLALPVSLLPEEVALLVSKGIAKLVQYSNLQEQPTSEMIEQYRQLMTELLNEQKVVYKEQRKEDLNKIIDKIVAGKKRKHSDGNMGTKEEILEEELNKSCDVTEQNMLVPILNSALQVDEGKLTYIHMKYTSVVQVLSMK